MFINLLSWFVIVSPALLASVSYGQELVVNGGFEEYSVLPDFHNQLNRADGWFNPMFDGCITSIDTCGTPDYLHMEGSGLASLPDNFYGYCIPFEGYGLAGIVAWNNVGAREYLSSALISNMIIGARYRVQFSLTNGIPNTSTESGTGWGTSGLGVMFSSELPIQNSPIVSGEPQIIIDSILFSNQWETFSFVYLSDSSYSYLSLGNFHSETEITAQSFVNESSMFDVAYYFVDNISVVRLDSVSSISESASIINSIRQNQENIAISLSIENMEHANVFIYDMAGKHVARYDAQGQETVVIPIGHISKGLYVLNVETLKGSTRRKVMIP